MGFPLKYRTHGNYHLYPIVPEKETEGVGTKSLEF